MGAGMKRTPESHPDQAALIGKIKAHIDKGDKAKAQAEHAAGKAEQHYFSAGQYLKTLKEQHNGSWAEWEELLKTKIGIGKSRASELMAIADGTKTTKQVRADTNKRKITHRTSPFRNGETRRERQRKANAECERDREACIALDQKVTSAERELAQLLANHPYPDPIVAEWLKGSEPAEQVVEEPVAKPKPEARRAVLRADQCRAPRAGGSAGAGGHRLRQHRRGRAAARPRRRAAIRAAPA
jgi:hypothetical protein